MPRNYLEVEPIVPLRWVKEEHYGELINLYHLARTALSGQSCTTYDRMIWATKEFAKKYNYLSATAAYKDLSARLSQ